MKQFELSDLQGEKTLYKAIVNRVGDTESILLYFGGGWVLIGEDENDGYRSTHYGPIPVNGYDDIIKTIFGVDVSNEPYIRRTVILKHTEVSEGYGDGADIIIMTDKETGKEVARFGTDNIDDYYPSYVQNWIGFEGVIR